MPWASRVRRALQRGKDSRLPQDLVDQTTRSTHLARRRLDRDLPDIGAVKLRKHHSDQHAVAGAFRSAQGFQVSGASAEYVEQPVIGEQQLSGTVAGGYVWLDHAESRCFDALPNLPRIEEDLYGEVYKRHHNGNCTDDLSDGPSVLDRHVIHVATPRRSLTAAMICDQTR